MRSLSASNLAFETAAMIEVFCVTVTLKGKLSYELIHIHK